MRLCPGCNKTFIDRSPSRHTDPLGHPEHLGECRVLEVRNVTRMFGRKAAVDSASFVVDRAAFVGIIGRSGAGKSTLLRMMNRLTDV